MLVPFGDSEGHRQVQLRREGFPALVHGLPFLVFGLETGRKVNLIPVDQRKEEELADVFPSDPPRGVDGEKFPRRERSLLRGASDGEVGDRVRDDMQICAGDARRF